MRLIDAGQAPKKKDLAQGDWLKFGVQIVRLRQQRPPHYFAKVGKAY
jgi:hypothetical protein